MCEPREIGGECNTSSREQKVQGYSTFPSILHSSKTIKGGLNPLAVVFLTGLNVYLRKVAEAMLGRLQSQDGCTLIRTIKLKTLFPV